ncbi:MAG: DUF2231 domain-containing protein [Dermatophilaceae bacterium]
MLGAAMFDTVLGLPVHILVIHAVVVLAPVAGLTAVGYGARPAWRAVLRWPLVALVVIAAASSFVAAESGEALESRLRDIGLAGAALEAVEEHAEAGELARNVAALLLVVALVAALWLARPGSSGATAVVVSVMLAVVGVGVVVTTVVAGHRGSSAVWSDLVENSG